MGGFLVWTWFLGMLVAGGVFRARSGIGFWTGRIRVFGPGGCGVSWVATMVVAMAFWPVTMALWLARGRPEPRVVFNEKAEERRRRQSSGVGAQGLQHGGGEAR